MSQQLKDSLSPKQFADEKIRQIKELPGLEKSKSTAGGIFTMLDDVERELQNSRVRDLQPLLMKLDLVDELADDFAMRKVSNQKEWDNNQIVSNLLKDRIHEIKSRIRAHDAKI